MPAMRELWTVDMLDALPDDGQRYELIDGALSVTPAPGIAHQLVVLRLAALLDRHLGSHGVGRTVIAPADVRRAEHERNRVQPDVFVVRLVNGRRPTYPFDLRDLLLAVEVSSPGSTLRDYQVKRDLYLSEGVKEYWIVNPDARNVSRWRERADQGDVLSESIEWHCEGMPDSFRLGLPEFFSHTLD